MTYTHALKAVRNEIAELLCELATAADQATGEYLQGRIAFVLDAIPVADLKQALTDVAEELKANG